MSQGLGCSPIKVARELGSERRETVRSLSVVGVGSLIGADLSTRGPGWTDRWCTSCLAKGTAGWLRPEEIRDESIKVRNSTHDAPYLEARARRRRKHGTGIKETEKQER